MNQTITKSINIAELVEKHPAAARRLMEEGFGCLGCAIANQETLEQGLIAHGKTEEEIFELVDELNQLVADSSNDQ